MQEERKVIAILNVDDAKAKECNIGTIDYLASVISTATDETHDEKSVELDDAWICDDDDPEDGAEGWGVVGGDLETTIVFFNRENARDEYKRQCENSENSCAMFHVKIRV